MSYYLDEESQFILREDEKFHFFMDPLKFLEKNKNISGLVSPCIILNLFQDFFFQLINSYFSELSLSRLEKTFYPFSGCSSQDIRNELNCILRLSNLAADIGIYFKNYNRILRENLKFNAFNVAEVISALYFDYQFLARNFGQKFIKKHIIENTSFFEKSTYLRQNKNYLKPLVEFSFSADDLIYDLGMLVLYGSLATFDYVEGFSDINLFGVIRSDVFEDAEKILSLRKRIFRHLGYFYDIDPFQNYGIVLITELDLKYFSQGLLPIGIFKHSVSLFEHPSQIEIYQRDSLLEEVNHLWRFCYRAREEFLAGRMINSLLEFKSFIRELGILPCIYYNVDGIYLSRNQALDKFVEEFNFHGKAINEAVIFRKNWQLKALAKKYKRFLHGTINPFIWPESIRITASWKEADRNNYGKLLKSYFKLTENMIQILLKSYGNRIDL